jgi:hypothetical protein
MKKVLLFFILASVRLVCFGQVNFMTGSFDDAVARARSTGQMIFLQYDSRDCERCNDVATRAFEDKSLASQLESTFICYRVDSLNPDRELIAKLYNIHAFGSYFLDSKKTLIHSYPKSTTYAPDYKKEIDIALTRAGEDARINELEKEYRNGNRNPGMMEFLLQKRKSLNLDTDSLLDEYTSMLPKDSIGSPTTVKFVASFAPVIGSPANEFLRKDYAKFNQVWFTMDAPTRVSINNRIIYKTMQKAIRMKSEQYAYRGAEFAKATHNANSRAGMQTFENNMLMYYMGVNDTLNYIIRSLYYYDNYYMTISVDSVRAQDELSRKRSIETAVVQTGPNGKTFKRMMFRPSTQVYARSLREAADNYYNMATDPIHLQKALQWIVRANDFWQDPEIYDTWARLLYKSGKKKEAIAKEEEAIALQKKNNYPTTTFDKTLKAMKTGSSF